MTHNPCLSPSLKGTSQKVRCVPEKSPASDKKRHIFFEHGLIGIGTYQEYILSPTPKEILDPFYVLIQAQNPNIHFFLLAFEEVGDQIDPPLDHKIALELGLSPEKLEGYYLVTAQGIEEDNLSFSINKQAPLFIDTHQKGGQYIFQDSQLPSAFVLTHLSTCIRKRLKR